MILCGLCTYMWDFYLPKHIWNASLFVTTQHFCVWMETLLCLQKNNFSSSLKTCIYSYDASKKIFSTFKKLIMKPQRWKQSPFYKPDPKKGTRIITVRNQNPLKNAIFITLKSDLGLYVSQFIVLKIQGLANL